MSTNDQDKVLDFGLTLLPNRQKASTKCTQLQDKHCRSLSQSCAQQDIGVIFNERSRSGDMVELSSNFIPGPSDVICGRGSSAAQHPGNTRFHSIISSNLMLYSEAQSKLDKSLIVSSIIKSIENGSPPGRFVKQINGLWCEVGDNLTREKCGQT